MIDITGSKFLANGKEVDAEVFSEWERSGR